EAVGCGGFATEYRRRTADGDLAGDYVPVDFVANASSLGARSVRAASLAALEAALREARQSQQTTVIVVPVARAARAPSYDSWWDVPVAETSTLEPVRGARAEYDRARQRQRPLL